MCGKCKIYFISIVFLLFLNSCVTVETYIDNDRYDYNIFPITTKYKLIFGTDYFLDNYKLAYKGDVDYEGNNGKIETSEYIFYENNIEICKLEVTETTKKGFLIFAGSYEKHIKFIYPNGINSEYKINTLNDIYPEESYLIFQNDSNGTIIVNKYYEAINKNNMEHIQYHMGYDILVNNERYGILSLEPRAFYLKANNKIERKMALYILSILVSNWK